MSLLRGALGLALCSLAGCQSYVIPTSPRPNDTLANLGRAPGPVFEWQCEVKAPFSRGPFPVSLFKDKGTAIEYTLIVTSQGEEKFKREKITESRFAIPPGEGWLPGGRRDESGNEVPRQYEWRVDATLLNPDGSVYDKVPCKEARSFKLAQRETVKVQVSAPRSGTGDDEQKVKAEFTVQGEDDVKRGDFELTLEQGERREMVIKATNRSGKTVTVSGTLSILAATENTRFGKVLISDLKFEELVRAAEEGIVGEHKYKLGEEEIAVLKLGSRN